MTPNTCPLIGDALVARYKQLLATGDYTDADIAVDCGYYTEIASGPRQGIQRANVSRMNKELLIAQGLAPARARGQQQSGKRIAVVGKNGGARLTPGMLEALDIGVGSKLHLTQAEGDTLIFRVQRVNAEPTAADGVTVASPNLVAA